MILEGSEGTSLPGGPVVKNPPVNEAGDRVFSIDPWSRKMPLGSGQIRYKPTGWTVPVMKATADRRGTLDGDNWHWLTLMSPCRRVVASTLLWGRMFLGLLGNACTGGAGDLRELSVLSAPCCPRNPNPLKERIHPMERQTHTWVNLMSVSLGFWKHDG